MTSQSMAGSLLRLIVGFLAAAIVTLALFWTMQLLITSGNSSLQDRPMGYIVDFVRIQREEIKEQRPEKPRKPPAPANLPPDLPPPKVNLAKPSPEKIAVRAVPVQPQFNMSPAGFNLDLGDGDYLPIVKVAPVYPRRALSRGIEGWVILEFTVTTTGSVRDVTVVDSLPKSTLFHEAAIRAAQRFKYKPRVIDGVAAEVRGVRNKITFRIEGRAGRD